MIQIKFITSIQQIDTNTWDNLARGASPFCQYHFLQVLETSGSVGPGTGWFVQHCIASINNEIVAILPLYKKTHSYGEYVFDFAWANAYREHGIQYYPKLIAAIPFTPVTSSKLMIRQGYNFDSLLKDVCQKIEQHLEQFAMSSMHWLFVEEDLSKRLDAHNFTTRRSVQFEWFNRGYGNFDHYLATMNARRRRSITKERKKIAKENVVIHRFSGDAITPQHMAFFYECYKQTYLKRSGHEGYLTQAFFTQLHQTMTNHLLLVVAEQDDEYIASSLFLFDENQLCGRYWGALQEVSGLHFECCYYQGIEFCIEHKISRFNPGTQGEHKILRGFEPIYCYSNHKLKELAFHEAVERFIQQEDLQINAYKENAAKLLPFKQESEQQTPTASLGK